MGYLHIDMAQINVSGHKCYLLVAIDRATRYVYVELNDHKTMAITAQFLKNALAQYPFKSATSVDNPWTNGMVEAMNKN